MLPDPDTALQRTLHQACRAGPTRAAPPSADRLADAQDVAVQVPEPDRALTAPLAGIVAGNLGDAAGDGDPGHRDVLELQAAAAQVGDGRLDVVDAPAHLRVRAGS